MLKPMEPEYQDEIDQSGQYFFQIKWDGIRLIADKADGVLTLYTRKGRIRTKHYPELLAELNQIPYSDFLMDGEVIAIGSDGLPDFQEIIRRDLSKQTRRDIPIAYMAFDCLRFQGTTLVHREIEERQSYLNRLLERPSQSPLISQCRNFDDGIALFSQMEARGMEGIVAKRRQSGYVEGRKTSLWQKTKCWREIEVVAKAVNYREGRPASVAVSLSEADDETVGSVATGLSADDWSQIIRTQIAAFSGAQSKSIPLSSAICLQVRFLEWTHDGHLRSPTVIRVKKDR